MASTSCSHWWHLPIYFSLSVALAVIAITSFSTSPAATSPTNSGDDAAALLFSSNHSAAHHLSLNASKTLRSHGFTFTSFLLQFSPDFFFSPSSPPTTLFALPDSAVANISIPPWAMKRLFQYHTSTAANLTFRSLLRISSNTCLATSLQGKNISVTRVDRKKRSVEINDVPVTHPDLFLGGSISIHGVLGPFTELNAQEISRGEDFIHSSDCSSSFAGAAADPPSQNAETGRQRRRRPAPGPEIQPETRSGWRRVIRVLSSNGFLSFAVGLNSVLDDILSDYPDMDSGTVFAPAELGSVGSSSDPSLGRVVRYHILPERYRLADLALLPDRAKLRTLLKEKDLEITRGFNSSEGLAVDGVNVTRPEIFFANGFIVHAISQALDIEELANV